MEGEWLAPLMFIGALLLIFTGFPVALALGGTAMIFAVIGIEMGMFDWPLLLALPDRTFGIMSNFVLLAIPFFIFMGTMLEKSRLAEDLLTTVGQVFGPVRGGLAFAVVFVGALLAAATGVVGASVVAMGLISLPVMMQYGYSKELSVGVITASGTLGQIIPPSVVLIVLADQMGISVGDLFMGALVPGILLAGLYAVYVGGVAIFQPWKAPALPAETLDIERKELVKRVFLVLLPPLVLILLVLGSIFSGVATPTEAGALGAIGAMGLAAANRRLTWKALKETMDNTTKLTSMVMFLLIGSTAFALVFRGLNGDLWIEHLLTNLPGGVIGAFDRSQPCSVHSRLFYRLLRDRVYRDPVARAGCRFARYRSRLVRRYAGHEPTDVLLDTAFRLCLVLPARGGPSGNLDGADLPRRRALHYHSGDRASANHYLAGARHLGVVVGDRP